MRIVVTSSGTDLDAPASPVFGRCRAYIFVDTESMTYEAVPNPAIAAASGAGIQAAQFVIDQGVQALVTGNVGPNALAVFQSAGVTVYPFGGGTVREAAEAFRTGRLQSIVDATAQAGQGLSPEMVSGPGAGYARGTQSGMGLGRGMGHGMGRGRRRGAGMRPGLGLARPAKEQAAAFAAPLGMSAQQARANQAVEIATLKETAKQLQVQLAHVIERLEQLQGRS